jgi:hypothetical protein
MWRVFGGSARGRSHLANDSACQDFCAWQTFGPGLCVAVADGAGSRPRSARGARVAVESVLAWAESTFSNGRLTRPLEEAFHWARAGVVELAQANGCAPEEYATTLAVAAADLTSVRIGQLGDSIGVVRRASGTIEPVAPYRRAEYANETTFLTDDFWLSDLRLTRFPLGSVTAVSLSTDGLQFKILADVAQGIPYFPFFRDLFSWAAEFGGGSESLVRFLDELDDDQSDDDKTLVVAVRTSGEPPSKAPTRRLARSPGAPAGASGSASGTGAVGATSNGYGNGYGNGNGVAPSPGGDGVAVPDAARGPSAGTALPGSSSSSWHPSGARAGWDDDGEVGRSVDAWTPSTRWDSPRHPWPAPPGD